MLYRTTKCLLALCVVAASVGLALGGYWEVRFYSGSDLEEYWKYSHSFALEAHSSYYPISNMQQGEKRNFYTRVDRQGTLDGDWWMVNHFVWDDELEWVSKIKSGWGVQFLFDSGGSGYHHYDTRWKFSGLGTHKWFKSGAKLEAVSTGETYVATISHANDADPWPDIWRVTFANSGHRYFQIE